MPETAGACTSESTKVCPQMNITWEEDEKQTEDNM